jgi:hypothetical protein
VFSFSAGYNVWGDAILSAVQPTDLNGVTSAQLNLALLAYNGGPTMTHALLSGSVAIDRGFGQGIAEDQRGPGYPRTYDNPTIANPSGGDGTDAGAFELHIDTDGDGIWNVFDPDDDNDGVADGNDAFPLDPAESIDTDHDGIGNNADTDDDDDGVLDVNDAFPLNPAEWADNDGDGIGNNADTDDDNDGVADTADNCPLTSNPSQADFDGDGIGDSCDPQTGPPANAAQCKHGGWAIFNVPRTFANQNDCQKFVKNGN